MSQIVVAWTETESRIDPLAPMARRDLGERPKLVEFAVPKAAMWIRNGSKSDLAKARSYAARLGYRVFSYPISVSGTRCDSRRSGALLAITTA